MSVYYIDDSFFENTEYARQMLYKLEICLQEKNVSKILISIDREINDKIKRYKERFENLGVEVYFSTQVLFLNEERVLLTNKTLQMCNQEIRCYAGTICVVNEETLEWKRIYLDFFPQEETDIITLLQEAIEQTMGFDSNQKLKS